MKKLMIAAAIAFAAVTSQAYALKWNLATQLMNGWDDGKSGQAGTVYIYNSLDTGVSRQGVLNYLLALDGAAAVNPMNNGSYTTADGKMIQFSAKQIAADASTFKPVRKEEGGVASYVDYFYAMVIEDSDKVKHVYVSEEFHGMISTTQTTYLAGDVNGGSKVDFGELTTIQTGGGWYTAAVPEPTSGLLLLLGVAGLALRRRRA